MRKNTGSDFASKLSHIYLARAIPWPPSKDTRDWWLVLGALLLFCF